MIIYEKMKPIFIGKRQVTVRIPMAIVTLLDIKEGDKALFQVKTKQRGKTLLMQWIPSDKEA